MKKIFKDLATYVRLHDGYNKPKINFQELYRLFPQFNFTSDRHFGEYINFGEAFEHKNYSTVVTDDKDNAAYLIYKEYSDANENTAYLS